MIINFIGITFNKQLSTTVLKQAGQNAMLAVPGSRLTRSDLRRYCTRDFHLPVKQNRI